MMHLSIQTDEDDLNHRQHLPVDVELVLIAEGALEAYELMVTMVLMIAVEMLIHLLVLKWLVIQRLKVKLNSLETSLLAELNH